MNLDLRTLKNISPQHMALKYRKDTILTLDTKHTLKHISLPLNVKS